MAFCLGKSSVSIVMKTLVGCTAAISAEKLCHVTGLSRVLACLQWPHAVTVCMLNLCLVFCSTASLCMIGRSADPATIQGGTEVRLSNHQPMTAHGWRHTNMQAHMHLQLPRTCTNMDRRRLNMNWGNRAMLGCRSKVRASFCW